MLNRIMLLTFLVVLGHPLVALSESSQVLVETVVASVAGEPITLNDVQELIGNVKRISLSDLKSDVISRQALEQLIGEKLILEEAKSRHLKVRDDEIDSYIDEVAGRNSLSRSAFEQALKEHEGKSIQVYKREIKAEILKSKIAASMLQNTLIVPDSEVDEFIKQHAELEKSGSKVKLSQILIASETRSEEELEERLDLVREQLASGVSFSELAMKFSDGPGAAEGGALGVMSEEDLSPALLDAVLKLKVGEISEPVNTPMGYHLIKLDERFVEKEKDKIRAEVRELLKRQRMETKLATFFSVELGKKYYVDRKI